MNEDHSDSEGPSTEGGFFHKGHHGQNSVVAAEIMIKPELVDKAVAVLLQKLDTFAAGAGDPCGSGERSEVVNAEDNGHRYG